MKAKSKPLQIVELSELSIPMTPNLTVLKTAPPATRERVGGRENLDIAGVCHLSPLPTSPRWGEGSERLRCVHYRFWN